MRITATFSNGYTDTYKGNRDVKAAWMVTLPSGEIISGHSMDRTKAEKTARGNAANRDGQELLKTSTGSIAYERYSQRVIKDEGFRSVYDYNKATKAKKAEFLAKCKIEVIDVSSAQ
jgi:hypothetical protein